MLYLLIFLQLADIATSPNVGKLMIKAGAPANDNDGTVVGTQT